MSRHGLFRPVRELHEGAITYGIHSGVLNPTLACNYIGEGFPNHLLNWHHHQPLTLLSRVATTNYTTHNTLKTAFYAMR